MQILQQLQGLGPNHMVQLPSGQLVSPAQLLGVMLGQQGHGSGEDELRTRTAMETRRRRRRTTTTTTTI